MRVKISADSTCDLPRELLEKYDIAVTPLYIVKNGESFRDGVDIVPEDIYAHVAAGGELCTTAAVTVADYIDFFTKRREECDAVIHFHISAGMSGCYQNAVIAAQEVEGVYPVDSRNLSTGIGLQVIAAAEMAASGAGAEEILQSVEDRWEKVDVSFLVDNLSYLRKGGRCTALAALGANLMQLKPCIEVRGGKMGVGKKYRGSMEKCLLQYVRERLENRDDIDTRRIFITDSGKLSEEFLERLTEEVCRCQNFEEVLHNKAGCTISSHCGPGSLGILYYHK